MREPDVRLALVAGLGIGAQDSERRRSTMTEVVKIGGGDGAAVQAVDDEKCSGCGHDAHGDQLCPEPVCACEGEA
jgi:hypothetical protein